MSEFQGRLFPPAPASGSEVLTTTTAVTANPTTSDWSAPRPHYADISKTDAYALSPDVSAIELDRQQSADTNMHGIGENFLGTSAPDVLQTDDASAQSTELQYRRFRVPQLVAAQLQGIWAGAVADALEYIRDAVKRRHDDSIAAGIQHLLMLASEVLGDNRAAAGSNAGLLRACATSANALEPPARVPRSDNTRGATRSDNSRGKSATVKENALAGRIHRHVRNGNDGRAARCLDSSRMAVVDDTTMAKLKAVHPPASPPVPPTVEEGPAGPAQVDADRFLGILQRLPQGTASGLRGWTYEHIRAAGLHSQRTRDAMRWFVNDLLSGDIPHCHLLLASRLNALEKPQGGVRPIPIGEAFLRLSSICALSTAQNAADLLAPLQIGVGISGGAEIPGHSLRPDFCNPDVVTVQVDLQNAFNLANRGDMVHAIADKLPILLPYVLMAYQQRSPLVIQQADGSHDVLWSEAGCVRATLWGRCCFH